MHKRTPSWCVNGVFTKRFPSPCSNILYQQGNVRIFKNIYSSTVLKCKFGRPVLHLSIPILCYFILHFILEVNIVLFIPLNSDLITFLPFRLDFFSKKNPSIYPYLWFWIEMFVINWRIKCSFIGWKKILPLLKINKQFQNPQLENALHKTQGWFSGFFLDIHDSHRMATLQTYDHLIC